MKILFLRGQVPTDRDPHQIMFDSILDQDDVWTQLAIRLGDGEIWYWGDKTRRVQYTPKFGERWVKSFTNTRPRFEPELIFARGGFREYDPILQAYPRAFKIYYGAGKRFIPQTKFRNYNLILCDCQDQMDRARKTFPGTQVHCLIKPAADNVFKPKEDQRLKYDVIFCANQAVDDKKGHKFFLKHVPKNLKVLVVGLFNKQTRKNYPNIDFYGWVPRKRLPRLYAASKVAAVCCTTKDSCPRVIPEALACNCPVLVLDRVRFWHHLYINEMTGQTCSLKDFKVVLQDMVDRWSEFEPREYYENHLTLEHAASNILLMIHMIRGSNA